MITWSLHACRSRIVTIPARRQKNEARREAKAQVAAQLENSIEHELLVFRALDINIMRAYFVKRFVYRNACGPGPTITATRVFSRATHNWLLDLSKNEVILRSNTKNTATRTSTRYLRQTPLKEIRTARLPTEHAWWVQLELLWFCWASSSRNGFDWRLCELSDDSQQIFHLFYCQSFLIRINDLCKGFQDTANAAHEHIGTHQVHFYFAGGL